MQATPMPMPPRIGLIHALQHSIEPINQAFKQAWPQATLMNVLDDTLSMDLAANQRGLDATMHQRFQVLAQYAVDQGCDALLFTCSAFGACIEAVAERHHAIPVLKPNQAMIEQVVSTYASDTIGLIASFAPTLQSMPREFPSNIRLKTALVESALIALNQGDGAGHDAAVVQAAQQLLAQGCTVIALSQFSMARAAQAVAHATGLPVLTTPSAAISLLQYRLSV
jgi:Asp/Glu/hydantoin racemase